MKIYFLNDTSSCHGGSVKVVENFMHYMKSHEMIGCLDVAVDGNYDLELIKACDALVVNAEGSIHHNAPWGITLLQAIEAAQKLNKKTYLLNCLYEKMDHRYDEIISKVDYVCARELFSFHNLKKLNSNTVLFPDYCILRPREGQILKKRLHGLVKTKTHHSAIYRKVFNKIKAVNLSIGKHHFDDYVTTYKMVDILLTGQHHALYAAALAGIPFVPTFSNSHKIESVIEWSGLPIRVCSTRDQVLEDIDRIRNEEDYRKLFQQFSEFLVSQREGLEQYLMHIFG